jgi:hypothetical protein
LSTRPTATSWRAPWTWMWMGVCASTVSGRERGPRSGGYEGWFVRHEGSLGSPWYRGERDLRLDRNSCRYQVVRRPGMRRTVEL